MNRGRNKEHIFEGPPEKKKFERLLEEATSKFETEVHCYCIMSNHYHLLLRNCGSEMSKFMHWISGKYATWYNKSHGSDGTIYKDRYKSKLVDSDEYLYALAGYIHRNPLTFVNETELADYPYSSLPCYLNTKNKPWLSKDLVNSVVDSHGLLLGSSTQNQLYEHDESQLLIDLADFLSHTRQLELPHLKTVAQLCFLTDPNHKQFDHLSTAAKATKRRRVKSILESTIGVPHTEVLLKLTKQWLSNTKT